MWNINGRKLINRNLKNGNFVTTFTDVLGNDTTATSNSQIGDIITQSTYKGDIYDTTASGTGDYTIFIGTGTTPPTVNDITLESPVTFSCLVNPSATQGADNQSTLFNFVLQNTTGEDKVITEIGLGTRMTSTYTHVLFNRRLLEDPVTVPAGENYSFSFSWNTSNLQE